MANPPTQTSDPHNQPGAALDAAIEAARLADPVINGPDGTDYVMVPRGFDLRTLPDQGRLPTYPAAKVVVDDRASLSAYANRFSGHASILIADYDANTIRAHLDWHESNDLEQSRGEPHGPLRHTVTLQLRLSEEFTRWNAFAGKLHSQEDFARFLEENASDVAEPQAADMIELSRDFEATVGQTYKSSTRLDNGDRRIRFEAESKAMNEVVIPQKFTMHIPIFNGEQPDTLTALFRWRAQPGGGVMFGFEWHRLEYQRRAHFNLIATTAAEETGLPVFYGRVTG
jgi:uncharacterized protein YfdQ (DUF2303 family)